MPGALSHHRPQVPSSPRLLQHQGKPRDGKETVRGRLKPSRESYLPVQKGCDQAKVLRMLHEPAGARGRGLVWVLPPTPLAAGLPCPARLEQRGQLPEGLRGLRKHLSAAQLPRKTGTLNLAQWSWAGQELQCTDVHHGVGQGRGAGSTQQLPITLLEPTATQAHTDSRTGTEGSCTPGRGLRIWQGKGEELPSMAKRKHPAAWLGVPLPLCRTPSPAGLSGAAAKDGKGNPNPGRKHRVATLLSCSRDPRWHGSSEEHRLLPRERSSCQQARLWLQQLRRVHRPPGGSCPQVQRCLLQQNPSPSWWGSSKGQQALGTRCSCW